MIQRLLRWWHGRDIDQRLRKHGWTAIYVGDYATAPTWTYTLGLEETLNQPELVVFDVTQEAASAILWTAFEELKAGTLVLEDGKRWHEDDPDGRLVWRKVDSSQIESRVGWFTLAVARRLVVKREMFGLEVFQLVLADENQRMPWEGGYNENLRFRQPALYLPATDYGDEPVSPPEEEALRIADERGWSIMQVRGDLEWAYTIGLVDAGRPELIAFLPADMAANILHEAQAYLARGDLALQDGLQWSVLGIECCWRRVDESQYLGLNVFRLAKLRHEQRIGRREAVEAYQLFLPDNDGRYPWEPGCATEMRDLQPLLFEPFDPNAKRGPLATLMRM